MGVEYQFELNGLEGIDELQGKNPNCAYTGGQLAEGVRDESSGSDVNIHSSVRKSSNSEGKFSIRKLFKEYYDINSGIGSSMGAAKKPPEETSSDSSHDSWPSSETENDDPDDEDFNIENYNSSSSEDSLSSFSDESDKDNSSKEDIEENIEKQCDEETTIDGHVLTREPSGKKRQTKVFISQGLDEGGNRNRTLGTNEENKQRKENFCSVAAGGADCMDQKIEEMAKKKQFRVPKYNDLIRALIDSVGRGEVLEAQACEQEAKQSPPNKFTLPLKFRFEDEEPKPVEKSDYEKMEEDLFSEMHSLMYGDTNAFSAPEVTNKTPNASNVNSNKIHPCCEGNHDLIIHDEIGEICRICHRVEREMKDIIEWPEFAKSVRRGIDMSTFVDNELFSAHRGMDFASAVDNFGDSINAVNGTVWETIPGVRETMYPHQQEGFEFLWKNLEGTIDLAELKNYDSSRIGGCIISHAPGTGKTRLTIVFMQTYLNLFPSCRPIIIVPAGMLLTWEEEFRKWQVDFPFHNLNNLEFSGKEHKKLLEIVSVSKCPQKDVVRLVKMYSWSKQKSILGVSYNLYEQLVGERSIKAKGRKKRQKMVDDEQSENYRKMLLEMPKLVVFDEGHTPRSQRSCIWNTLLKLQTKRRIILSGTPFQNNFGELFNTLRLVRPTTAGVFVEDRTFADMISRRGMYLKKKFREEGASFTCSSAEAVEKGIGKLKAVIAPFVHVHKGSILQKNLPGLRDCVILLNPPPRQKCLIEKVEGTPSTFEYDHKVALISVHPSLLEHCSLADNERSGTDQHELEQLRLEPKEGVKTRFIMELVRLSRDMNEKVLVFSQYIQPLRLIKDQLKALFGFDEGKEVFCMQGGLEQKHRQSMINIFNDLKSEACVFLASTKCCSEGISLVGASRIVLLDVVWNPSVERQAISRAYRLGQKKVVYTYHLMTAGTTEGDKYCRQAAKDRLSDLVFASTTKENEKQKNPASGFDDSILEQMLGHAHLKDMFEKIIYQPKEANLMETFGLVCPIGSY